MGPEAPSEGGACPEVGRYGNWFRSGDQVILLLDEDDTPLDEGAVGAPAPDAAPAPPTEGAPGVPTEGAPGAPSTGAPAGPTEGTQGELWGRRRHSRRRLSLIQQALNYLRGLRLRPNGVADPPTRSALRSYQRRKGLTPHGRADYGTELALARDILRLQRSTEYEGPEIDPCVQECERVFRECLKLSTSPLSCLARRSTCLLICDRRANPPTPPAPTPVPPAPTPPAPCPTRPTRRFGSTGPAVKELQERLNAQGATPPLKVDGIFGPLTDAAVRGFQRSRGLSVDGVVGPKTWAALGC
jgi:peptidoglycan hydrolase-like protein with peptidoglycan-binding domain